MIQPTRKAWYIIIIIFDKLHSINIAYDEHVFTDSEGLRSAELLVDLIVALLPTQLQPRNRSMEGLGIVQQMVDVLNKAILAFPDIICQCGNAAEGRDNGSLIGGLIMPSTVLQFLSCLSCCSKVLQTKAGKNIFNPDHVVLQGELP